MTICARKVSLWTGNFNVAFWSGCEVSIQTGHTIFQMKPRTRIQPSSELHADTIIDMLAAKIDASDAQPSLKSALKANLKKLPSTVLQAASTDLVKGGLDHLPNVIHWLQKLTGLG